MKGLFIPDITTEMFRNGCLEGIEALMAESEVYDIEYDPKSAEPERKTGKWTRSHGIYCDKAWCSNCSSAFSIDPNHPFKTPMDWKYCPDCGCRMV